MLLSPTHRSSFQTSAKLLMNSLLLCVASLLLSACSNNDTDPVPAASKSIPQNIVVNSGTRAVELSWSGVAGASDYTVYWSNQPGVTPRSGYPVHTTEPILIHSDLTNGVMYYYVITATKTNGEGAPSAQVNGQPQVAVPAAPVDVVAQAGDSRVSLSWVSVAGASQYIVYWSNQSGVSESDTRIDNAISPLVHSDLQNGSQYHYIIVAQNEQGIGVASTAVQAQPQEAIPTAAVMTDAVVSADAVELHWVDVSEAPVSTTEYDLYWNSTGNVSQTDAVIRGVTSPYNHAPLSSGQDYYYRVQARNSAGVSGLSNSVHVQPPSTSVIDAPGALAAVPDTITIRAEDGQLSLSWEAAVGAAAYNLYWIDSVTGLLDRKIANIQSPYSHIQLSNGTTYRYQLSAINDHGESALSVEFSATPQIIIAGVPAGVVADGGDEILTVRWLQVENASSYRVYITEDVVGASAQEIQLAESPLLVDASKLSSGLVNGQAYRVEVAAMNNQKISARSIASLATPQEPVPNAPSNLSAEPGDGEVLLQWSPAIAQDPSDSDESVTGYKVYFSKQIYVTPLNGTVIAATVELVTDAQGNPRLQLPHTGLDNGQRYYYIVTAENVGGESRASEEVWARPQVPIPTMPNNIWADAGDNQVVLHFSEALEGSVTSYNLYWNKALSGGSGRSTTQVITNVLPGYVFTDGVDANGNTYYFRLSTVNAGGESGLSAEVSASPQVPPPQGAPQNVIAVAQQSQVSFNWTPVANADAYVLYWSTEATIDPALSPRVSGATVQPGYVHTGLVNGQVYYYQVSAVNAGGESALSAVAVAMPQWNEPGQPVNVVVVSADAEVYVNWPAVATATSYTLYWHLDPINNNPLENWSSRTAVVSGSRVAGLLNGQLYHFRLQAHNAGGDSPVSAVVSAVPEQAAPASPLGFSAASGDGQVSLTWATRADESYTIYWTSDQNLPIQPLSGWNQLNNSRPTYVHTEVSAGVSLSNGAMYRYQLTVSNSGGESAPAAEVNAIPAVIATTAPQALRALGGDSEVQLSWLPPGSGAGPYTYSVYWSDTAGQGKGGTAINNISSTGYVHTGRSNGQTYYYVVSATDANNVESVASLAASAMAQGDLPGQVMGVWVEPGDGQNTVRWQSQTNVTQYQVEWSTQVDGNNALQGSISAQTVLAPALQFLHTALTNGTAVHYRVSGQNNNGAGGGVQSGPASSVVTGTPLGGSNQPPQIQQGTLVSVTLDEDSNPTPFSLSLAAIDNNSDTLIWRIAAGAGASHGTAGVIGTGDTATVTYNPDLNWDQSDQFSVEVDDSNGGVDAITVNVTITPQNDAPVFNTALVDQSNVDGAIVTLDASASDVDNTALLYSALGLPAGLSLDVNTGQISGVVSNTASLASPYTVNLTVDDQSGSANSQDTISLTWNVTSVGADPSQSTASVSPVAANVLAGTDIIITVTARDGTGAVIATGGEGVALTIIGANSNLTSVTPLLATDNGDGTYSVSYNAQLAGVDNYQLTMDRGAPVTIGGSYSKTITPLAADLANSTVSVPAGPYTSGAAVSLSAQLRDIYNNPTTGSVAFDISGANAQSLLAVAQGAGVYTVTYTPTAVGSDVIAVSINSTAVAGSPFTRSINASTASALNSSATIPAGPFIAGQTVTLAAQINDASNNPTTGFVSFDITGSNIQTVAGIAQGGGLYQVNYTPTAAGSDTIVALVDGAAIGTAVTRSVDPGVAAITASSVTITPSSALLTGDTITIDILTRDSNNNPTAAQLSVDVTGANPQTLTVSNSLLGSYSSSYVASNAGVDSYNVLIDGAQITTPTRTIDSSNVAPTDITFISSSIAENSISGTLIGSLSAVDDVGDTHTYSFVAPNNDAGARFSIVGNQIQVANATLLDFETATSHLITVQAQDQGALVFSKDFTINLTDTNDVIPVITNVATTPSIPENSTSVAVLSVADNDTVNAAFTYILSGVDALQFEVVANNLQFKTTAVPDFELPADVAGVGGEVAGDNIYHISVAVNDGVNTSAVKDFVVTVENVLDTLSVSNLNAPEAFLENDSTFVLAPMVITYPATTNVRTMIQLSDPAAGALNGTATGTVNFAYDSITGIMDASGTVQDMNLFLADVSFIPAINYATDFSINVAVSDVAVPAITVNGTKLVSVTPIAEVIAASSVNISPASPVIVGSNVNFDILLLDALSNSVAATVTISIAGVNIQNLTVANPALGNYSASYVANNAGIDNYTVLINGAQIATPSYTINPPDVTAPSLLSVSPVNLDNRMAINQQFILNFDEPIDPASVLSSGFTVTSGATPVLGSVTTTGNKIVFTPDANLSFGGSYLASFTDTVADMANNNTAVSTEWSVNVMQAPQVISVETYPEIRGYVYHQDSAGNIFHIWTEHSGTSFNSFYKYFDAASQTWSAPTNFIGTYSNSHRIAHSNNGFLIVYTKGSSAIYSTFYDGVTFTPELTLGYYSNYELASNGTGFALVYTDQSSSAWGNTYDPLTNTWGTPELLEQDASFNSSSMLIASDGTGYAVTWNESSAVGGNYNLIAKVYDGVAWGPNINLIIAATVSPAGGVKLAGNSLGYVMLWIANSRVNVNFYNGISNLSTLDDTQVIVSPYSPSLVATGTGEFVAAWFEGQTLQANIYSLGAWKGPSLVSSTAGGSRTKLIAGNNSYLLAYTTTVASQSHLYASIYDGTNWTTTTAPIASGIAPIQTIGAASSGDRYALVWEAVINAVSAVNAAVYDITWSSPARLDSRDSRDNVGPSPRLFGLQSGFMTQWQQFDTIGLTYHGSRYDYLAQTPVWAASAGDYIPLQLRGSAQKAQMASNNAGEKVAVWLQTSSYGIEYAYYSRNTGTGWSAPVRLPACLVVHRGVHVVSNGTTFMITCGVWIGGGDVTSYLLDGGVLGPRQDVFASVYVDRTYDILTTNGTDYAAAFVGFNDMLVNTFDSAAGVWTGEVTLPSVNTYRYNYGAPHIAGNNEGFTATWWQAQGPTTYVFDLFASTYKAGVWSVPVAVNTTSTIQNQYPSPPSSNIISMGSDYVLTWITDNIYSSVYDNVSSSWSAENVINTNGANASSPNSASNGVGYHTVWSYSGALYSRLFDGSVWSTHDLFLQQPSVGVGAPLTRSNGSGYGVIWTQNNSILQITDAMFSRYESSEWTAPLLLENRAENVFQPHISTSGSRYNAIWSQPDVGFSADPMTYRIWVAEDF